MKENKNKIIRYCLIEIFYLLLSVLFLFYLKKCYSIDNSYETNIFAIYSLVLCLIEVFFGPLIGKILLLFSGSVFTIYLIAQTIYHRAFDQYFRFKLVFTLFEDVLAFKESALAFAHFSDFLPLFFYLIFSGIFLFLYFRYQKKTISWKVQPILSFLSLFLIFPIKGNYDAFLSALDLSKEGKTFTLNETDYYCYEHVSDTNSFVKTFGLFTMGMKDMQSLFTQTEYTQEDIERISAFLETKPIHSDNEYTGLFKDKNVIFIQAESFNDIAIDPQLTPFLYKLSKEGIAIRGFDTPATQGSTSDSELAANLSLIPNSDNGAMCYTYPDNTYQATLAGLFKENGYDTFAYHNLYGTYYNRNILFPAMGYDHFYDCSDFGSNDLLSDSFCSDVLAWSTIRDNKTMVYWITYSGHQPYEYGSTGVSEEDVALIKAKYPDLSEEYVAYFAKNMDLDHAIENIWNTLDLQGKLEDTVLVFFGDHIVKQISLDEDADIYKESDIAYKEENSYTDLFFYNYGTEGFEYEKTGTLIDLLPTVANLFGFDYDDKTILGRDLFDPSYTGYRYSVWGVWRTDHYSYDKEEGVFTFFDDYDSEKAKEEIAYYKELNEVSDLIIALDYFAK